MRFRGNYATKTLDSHNRVRIAISKLYCFILDVHSILCDVIASKRVMVFQLKPICHCLGQPLPSVVGDSHPTSYRVMNEDQKLPFYCTSLWLPHL